MKKDWKIFFATLTAIFILQQGLCQLRLPRLVRDSMILQREANVKIWGWATPDQKVIVRFRDKKYNARADAKGNWTIMLTRMAAGGPFKMDISAGNTITLNNILVGDVWLCAGQSNMVHQLNIHDVTYAKEIAEANYPGIRQFLVPAASDLNNINDDLSGGSWKAAVAEDVRQFSAVAYFFAKQLYTKYKVPIGIINASVGGTPIEAWTSEQGLETFADIKAVIEKNKDTAYINEVSRKANAASRPSSLQKDKGLTETAKWYETIYQPKGWFNINIPGYWEDQGIKELDGVVWYRREINVPATLVEKPSRLFLGRIVDADVVYVNGKEIGNTTYLYPQRRYHLPANTFITGKNIITIKVTNTNGKGGFVPDKPYYILSGSDSIDLKGTWQYKVGKVFPPRDAPVPMALNKMNQPTALYNAMIAPLINFSVKGFVWYQGESNTSKASQYATLQPALINDWRNSWKAKELPFLYVQLPNFMEATYTPSESQWAALREAQLTSLAVPNTGMAVAIDLGEWNDIHPDNKKDVGERLALVARRLVYKENIVASGPIFQSATIDGNTITISFTNNGSGLITTDGEAPVSFAIAGEDKKFVWATAIISGNTIIVSNEKVMKPLYVRYAWADNPTVNLYNKEGLPASPFRTDK